MVKAKSVPTLTSREKEVLTLLVDGYSNEEVGTILSLSRRTVEAHRARIMLKLNHSGLTSLVKYALRHKLTSLDLSTGQNIVNHRVKRRWRSREKPTKFVKTQTKNTFSQATMLFNFDSLLLR